MNDRRAWSTGIYFITCGLVFGTWSASIPSVRAALGLDEAQLGSVILCFSVGVIFGNPASVKVMQRFGIYPSAALSLVLSTLAFAFAVGAFSKTITVCSLIFGGFAFSILNVAMNSGASWFEEATNRRIMSSCHGLWSVGAMAGSAICSAVLSTGIEPFWWFLSGILTICVLATIITAHGMRQLVAPIQNLEYEENTSTFQWPNAVLWSLIFVSLCTNLTEGTMADWAAIFMRQEVGCAVWLEGWGFGIYAFFMAVTRFFGDYLITKYSPQAILKYGGILACAGFMLAVWTQTTVPTLIGLGMIGAGVALSAPILYGASARVKGMAPGAGLATMNTFAMVGFLSGPALIGFLARSTSLPTAFTVVAGICLFWVYRSSRFTEMP
jgi:MFS family permease